MNGISSLRELLDERRLRRITLRNYEIVIHSEESDYTTDYSDIYSDDSDDIDNSDDTDESEFYCSRLIDSDNTFYSDDYDDYEDYDDTEW